MDLELLNCSNCHAQGVLPTSDGNCPNCKRPLGIGDRHTEDASTPVSSYAGKRRDTGGNLGSTGPFPRPAWQKRPRKRVWLVAGLTVCGILGLLLCPATLGFACTRDDWLSVSRTGVGNVDLEYAVLFLLIGWLLLELGLALSKARLGIQLVVRAPMYSYMLIMLCLLALIHWVNELPDI